MKRYEVWIIPSGEKEYKLRGRTDDRDGAESYCESAVMFGPYIACKVVDTATGETIAEMEL